MKCDRRRCRQTATLYVMGVWVCPMHIPLGRDNCSHSLAPGGLCAYCGADVRRLAALVTAAFGWLAH